MSGLPKQDPNSFEHWGFEEVVEMLGKMLQHITERDRDNWDPWLVFKITSYKQVLMFFPPRSTRITVIQISSIYGTFNIPKVQDTVKYP